VSDALRLLQRMGERGTFETLQACHCKDPAIRRCAIAALEEPLAMRETAIALSDPDELVRAEAVGRSRGGLDEHLAVACLTRALEDSSPLVRISAIHALPPDRKESRAFSRQLLALTGDSDPKARRLAVSTLVDVNPKVGAAPLVALWRQLSLKERTGLLNDLAGPFHAMSSSECAALSPIVPLVIEQQAQ